MTLTMTKNLKLFIFSSIKQFFGVLNKKTSWTITWNIMIMNPSVHKNTKYRSKCNQNEGTEKRKILAISSHCRRHHKLEKCERKSNEIITNIFYFYFYALHDDLQMVASMWSDCTNWNRNRYQFEKNNHFSYIKIAKKHQIQKSA